MNKSARKIAIIGGGSSGITAVKACLEEGLEPVCFERSSEVGGLWRYTDSTDANRGCVMKSTIINTSKELSAYSDFPPPVEFPNFMHNSMMIKYLDMYADKFGVRKYIKINHDVISVTPIADDSKRWTVKVKDLKSGEESEDVYDGVFICTGHHCFPKVPDFVDQKQFEGRLIHTHDYKTPTSFEGRQVCVVGIGNSGGDASVELSSVAEQVYLCVRTGTWVLPRVGAMGRPYDLEFLTKWKNFLFQTLPYSVSCAALERQANEYFDHELYNLKPPHRFFGQHVMVNDFIASRILSGTMKIKGGIKKFTKRGIVFEGDSEETLIDDVIFATGYEIKFPFLSEEVVVCKDNKMDLYKMVFDPKHPTLAFVGLLQPIGPLMPVSELQCRWIAQVFSGKQKLPSTKVMNADIQCYNKVIRARFDDSPRHTLEMDWVSYMDALASLVGAKPNLIKLFFTDFELWKKLVFGPSLPYQYRLSGPARWPEARKTLVEAEDRIVAALQTKNKSVNAKKGAACVVLRCTKVLLLLLVPILAVGWAFFIANSN